mmetsp:Transcript_13847/g.36946  ORF Transcript_13847/g.36946 Transcript_13847/m.36946 type:complete len:334 (-) Transcript_13847:307-1308(-)
MCDRAGPLRRRQGRPLLREVRVLPSGNRPHHAPLHRGTHQEKLHRPRRRRSRTGLRHRPPRNGPHHGHVPAHDPRQHRRGRLRHRQARRARRRPRPREGHRPRRLLRYPRIPPHPARRPHHPGPLLRRQRHLRRPGPRQRRILGLPLHRTPRRHHSRRRRARRHGLLALRHRHRGAQEMDRHHRLHQRLRGILPARRGRLLLPAPGGGAGDGLRRAHPGGAGGRRPRGERGEGEGGDGRGGRERARDVSCEPDSGEEGRGGDPGSAAEQRRRDGVVLRVGEEPGSHAVRPHDAAVRGGGDAEHDGGAGAQRAEDLGGRQEAGRGRRRRGEAGV